MPKVVLTEIGNLFNGSSLTAINDNFDKIEEAFDNTLSRDGTEPNTLQDDLDVNNKRIYNIPAPTSNSEPVRLSDLTEVATEIAEALVAEEAAIRAAADLAEATARSLADSLETTERLNADRALASIIGQNGSIDVAVFDSRLAMTFATIGQFKQYAQTGGYTQSGDGGNARYKRVTSEPSHDGKVRSFDRFLPDGSTDNVNGGWWELSELTINPLMFGAVGDGVTDDTAAFQKLAVYVNDPVRWALIAGKPRVINFGDRLYKLSSNVTIETSAGLVNGGLVLDNCTLILGTTGATQRYILDGFSAKFAGSSDYSGALVEVVRAFASSFRNCYFDAGVSFRARYGLFIGSNRAWGISVMGGRYYGGQVPLRIGKSSDHTGIEVGGGVTIDHGAVCNFLGCNLAGAKISGNIEHAENGAIGIALTSRTNGSSNSAHGINISGVYCYNNGNGTAGTDYAPAGMLIGYDVPGTMDWDTPGSLITSATETSHVTVENNYIVSDKQLRAVKIRSQYGATISNNKWVVGNGETIGFTFEGGSVRARISNNRNQNTGTGDVFEKTAGVIIDEDRGGGTWTPALQGSTTAGSHTYSTRGGSFSVHSGMAFVSGWIQLSSKDAAMAGSVLITLPVAIPSGNRVGGSLHALGVTGLSVGSGNLVQFLSTGNASNVKLMTGSADLTPSQIGNTAGFHFNLVYPVANGTDVP